MPYARAAKHCDNLLLLKGILLLYSWVLEGSIVLFVDAYSKDASVFVMLLKLDLTP